MFCDWSALFPSPATPRTLKQFIPDYKRRNCKKKEKILRLQLRCLRRCYNYSYEYDFRFTLGFNARCDFDAGVKMLH